MTTNTITPAALNPDVLLLIAKALVDSSTDPRTAGNIRTMHGTEIGQEVLRLIVRDDIGGAASIIANALWVD
jgi:hypothetical protein